MSSILRALFAYLLACLTAAIVIVAFVKPPGELLVLSAGERQHDLANTADLILAAATHSAIFAAAFALIAILVGAILDIRSALFYTISGLAISIFGFAALNAAEPENTGTILNAYAVTAYALSGIAGGFVYWLLAGRYAVQTSNADNTQVKATRDDMLHSNGKKTKTKSGSNPADAGAKAKAKSGSNPGDADAKVKAKSNAKPNDADADAKAKSNAKSTATVTTKR